MKSIGEVLTLGAQFLKERGIDQPRRVVEELLAFCLQCKRLDLYLQFDRPLEEEELECLRNLTKRSAKGEPLSYILGEVEFFGAQLSLSPAVLIPRPETEILVSLIADWFCSDKSSLEPKVNVPSPRIPRICSANDPMIILDLCCGSGAVGISLKKKFPESMIILSDLSKDALGIAAQNAKKNHVEVTFLEGDLLSPFAGQKADLIVCNPPYISTRAYTQLDASVRDFEPKLALIGGEDGLSFYRRLAIEAPEFFQEGGWLCLELGHDQGDAVSKIFSCPPWKNALLKQDWAGKDRFFFVERSSLADERVLQSTLERE